MKSLVSNHPGLVKFVFGYLSCTGTTTENLMGIAAAVLYHRGARWRRVRRAARWRRVRRAAAAPASLASP